MKSIPWSAVSNVRMAAGNEKKHPIVILDGIVKEWVGFGWIGDDKATKADFKKYPTVED